MADPDDLRDRLHHAADKGHFLDVYRLVFEENARVDTFKDGFTPLGRAASRGYSGVVALLLERGVDVNAAGAGGYTAAHVAAQRGRPVILAQLIKAGANMHAKTSSGSQPLELCQNDLGRRLIMASMGQGFLQHPQFFAGEQVLSRGTKHQGYYPAVIASVQGNDAEIKFAGYGKKHNEVHSLDSLFKVSSQTIAELLAEGSVVVPPSASGASSNTSLSMSTSTTPKKRKAEEPTSVLEPSPSAASDGDMPAKRRSRPPVKFEEEMESPPTAVKRRGRPRKTVSGSSALPATWESFKSGFEAFLAEQQSQARAQAARIQQLEAVHVKQPPRPPPLPPPRAISDDGESQKLKEHNSALQQELADCKVALQEQARQINALVAERRKLQSENATLKAEVTERDGRLASLSKALADVATTIKT